MYQLLFVAILFTCAFLGYISPTSSCRWCRLRAGYSYYLCPLLWSFPGVAVAITTLARSRPFWWSCVYWYLFPVIGTIILLVLMALPGESHDNRFGSPTGHVILTKQMAHEIGLIDATPTTGLTWDYYYVRSLAMVPSGSIAND